ncbi:MAG TPA: hypothetical protein VKY85_19270 [Candidatus Angelobacter sp.]|nr:hypothetical protein [Candidatus Angelobacter sp.]
MRNLSSKSKAFIALVVVCGAAVLVSSLARCTFPNWTGFLVLLAAALVASRLKVKMPGVTGSMSVNLPFILVAVAEMNTAEALLIGCLSALAQCLPAEGKKFNWTRGIFNFANMALAIGVTRLLYTSAALGSAISSQSLLLAVAAAGYYAVNSLPVAIVIALTENKNALRAWAAMLQLSYPYYLASAGVAGIALTASAHAGWQVPVLLLPLMAGIFYSYRSYFSASAVTIQAEIKRAPQSAPMAHAAS